MNNPMQPIINDKGILRFKPNKIIEHLVDNKIVDLNKIAAMDFSDEDRQQFAQLMGYSLSGYGDLNFVDNYSYDVAEKMYEQGISEKEARISYLEEKLNNLKNELRKPIAELFEIHEDDLT